MAIIKEWTSQVVFLASILAGFSLSIAVQLVCSRERQGIVLCSIVAFVVSAALLLATTAIASLILMRWEFWQSSTLSQMMLVRIGRVRSGTGSMLTVGVLLFLAGLGLVGWVHSKAIGVISLITVIVTALAIFWAARILP
jgi:uncharacterized membrane protein (UPF0136 family)